MQTEKELIQAIIKRDAKALSIVYDKYSGAVYGVILRICRDEEVSHDVLQEVFLKIWQKIHLYNVEKGKFFTWIYQIARNSALNAKRSNTSFIQNEDLAVYNNKEEEAICDYTELSGSLKKLEAHHQEVIELVYFKGLTHREAHEEMGVPLGTFKSYVKQALRDLRKEYMKEFFLIMVFIELLEK